jgi:exodeoxyribonuclease VII small subunit
MPARKKTKQTVNDFENSMGELESLVEAMESGELTLEESLEHFERGIKQVRSCQKALDEAEQKVKILLDDSEGAQLNDFDQVE